MPCLPARRHHMQTCHLLPWGDQGTEFRSGLHMAEGPTAEGLRLMHLGGHCKLKLCVLTSLLVAA